MQSPAIIIGLFYVSPYSLPDAPHYVVRELYMPVSELEIHVALCAHSLKPAAL